MIRRRPGAQARAATLALAILAHPAAASAPPVLQQPVSSYALIDRALATRTIDAETAHKYRVFAAFGDTRLPAAYRGDDGRMSAMPPAVAEVGALLANFSPATRAELEPFFMRPDAPGSWITLSTIPGQEPGNGRGDGGVQDLEDDDARSGPSAAGRSAVTWHNFQAAGGKAKVWWQDRYPSDEATALGIATELTNLIWGKLTGLMNIEPFPDNGIVNNGGDAAFDFYLVHTPPNGSWVGRSTSAVPAAPCHPARYILLDSRRMQLGSARTYGLLQVATHELMHALTSAYRVRGNGCPEQWIDEASGDWASNWVYPLTDGEHSLASAYMLSVEYRVDNPATSQQSNRFYGEHLLPYFLESVTGGPGFMQAMWSNFRSLPVLEGIHAIMPGGFDKTWPRFLVQLWNRPPVDAPDGFKAWDRLPIGVPATGGRDVVNASSGIVTRSVSFMQANQAQGVVLPGLQPIAGHYRHYQFDSDVRNVTFRNTIREEGIVQGTVWAIENIGGTWRAPVDLTEEFQKSWCRDEATEDLQELVLIFGNHDWKTNQPVNPQEAPTNEARSFGCAGWTGTSSVVATITSQDPALTIVESVNGTIRFEVDSAAVADAPGLPPEHWISVGGQISWSVRVTGTCTGNASGGTAIPRLRDDHVASLSVWSDGLKLHHSGATGPWPGNTPRFTIDCPDGPKEMVLTAGNVFFFTDPVLDGLAPDGKSFSGHHSTLSVPGVQIVHDYSFRCSRGC